MYTVHVKYIVADTCVHYQVHLYHSDPSLQSHFTLSHSLQFTVLLCRRQAACRLLATPYDTPPRHSAVLSVPVRAMCLEISTVVYEH